MSGGFVPDIARVVAGCMILFIEGCSSVAVPRRSLVGDVDTACGGPIWRARYALAADLIVQRDDGAPDIRAGFLYDTRNDRLVIQFPASGGGMTRCGFDGQSVWLDAPDGTAPQGWPTVLQWATCVAVPYRLTAQSLRVLEVRPVWIAGVQYRVAELRRPEDGPGTCALYVDSGTLRPRGAVPVRSASRTNDVARPPEYGFAYDEFTFLDDLILPTHWSVWKWDPGTGIQAGGPIASVTLKNPHFVEPDPSLFAPPPHVEDAPSFVTAGPKHRYRLTAARHDASANSIARSCNWQ